MGVSEKLSLFDLREFLENLTEEQALALRKFIQIRKDLASPGMEKEFYTIWDKCMDSGMDISTLSGISKAFLSSRDELNRKIVKEIHLWMEKE